MFIFYWKRGTGHPQQVYFIFLKKKKNLTFLHNSLFGSLMVTEWLLGVSYPVWKLIFLKECDILNWKASRIGSVINTKFFCVVGSHMLVIARQWPALSIPPLDSKLY